MPYACACALHVSDVMIAVSSKSGSMLLSLKMYEVLVDDPHASGVHLRWCVYLARSHDLVKEWKYAAIIKDA